MQRKVLLLSCVFLAMILIGAGCGKKSAPAPATPDASNPVSQDSYPTNNGMTDEVREDITAPVVEQGIQEPEETSPSLSIKNNMHVITLTTNHGDIQFTTYDADAPKTVQNFITLAQKGYYDAVIFHRVIKNFMIQGGDPTGTGRGGPGYTFEDELNPATDSYKEGYKRGVVAMANAGPNTNGSQFFIMHQDYPLPNAYTIFGKVVAGQDVVDKIANTATDGDDRPLQPVTISGVKVEEVK